MNNNTCYDCIHYDICYKIEHFGRDLETNMPCKEFIGANDRIEVVRCKDCRYYDIKNLNCKYLAEEAFLENFRTYEDDFCSYGKKRNSETT